MQTTSATYDRILAGTDYVYEARLIIDGVGTYGESDIMSISTNIEMFQEDPEIGKAISAEINVSMFQPSATIPTMAKIRPQVRACGTAPKSSKVTITGENLISTYATYTAENITFSSSSGATVAGENLSFAADTTEYLESEWLSQGVYYIDTREVTANNNGLDVLTLHGFDAMLKTEQIYSSNSAVGDDLDIAYVRAIASAIGVSVDPRTWEIMQTGYMIPFPLGYSMREILGYIASAYAGCFIISDTGQLRLVALEDIESETRYLIDEIGNIIVFGTNSPEHTVTASGAVATFTAGGEYALDELEIAIEPVQDLHGYANPYPAGGGANKWDEEWEVGLIDFTTGQNGADSTRIRSKNYTPCNPQTSYRLVATYAGVVFYYGNDKSYLSSYVTVSANAEFTTPVNAYYLRFFMSGAYGTTYKHNISINYPSSVTTFSTYENICPISGWTGMDINNAPTVIEFEQGGLYDASGGESVSNARIRSGYIPVEELGKGTNVLNLVRTNSADNADIRKRYFYWYDANKTYIHDANEPHAQEFPVELKRSYAPDGAKYLRLVLQDVNTSLPISPDDYKVSINETTYPISWQDEAGTVYKGTLNVKTGVLTALWKCKVYTGLTSESWNYSTWSKTNTWAFYSSEGLSDGKVFGANYNCIKLCNQVPCSNYTSLYDNDVPAIAISGGSAIYPSIRVPKTSISAGTASAFCTYLANNPLQILYELETPLTFQLTPTQVKTLLGQNNLWANTGNIINLKFTEPATEAVRILV